MMQVSRPRQTAWTKTKLKHPLNLSFNYPRVIYPDAPDNPTREDCRAMVRRFLQFTKGQVTYCGLYASALIRVLANNEPRATFVNDHNQSWSWMEDRYDGEWDDWSWDTVWNEVTHFINCEWGSPAYNILVNNSVRIPHTSPWIVRESEGGVVTEICEEFGGQIMYIQKFQ